MLPDKPSNLQITNVKSRSAEITWTAPQNTGDGSLERFLIRLTKDNSLIWSKTTGIENTDKLDNLTPYTTYKISVSAGNKHGVGEETIESFTTLEEGNLTEEIRQSMTKIFFSITWCWHYGRNYIITADYPTDF